MSDDNPLYSSLLSLLPHEYVNGNNSACDNIEEAAKYIKALEKNVKKLQQKKEKLENNNKNNSLPEIIIPNNDDGGGGGGSSSTMISSTNNPPLNEDYVKITALSDLLEIKISAMVNKEEDVFPLSKVLNILQQEGLVVVNCGYSKLDHTWVHIIHCQVNHGTMVDSSRLHMRLTREISSYAS